MHARARVWRNSFLPLDADCPFPSARRLDQDGRVLCQGGGILPGKACCDNDCCGAGCDTRWFGCEPSHWPPLLLLSRDTSPYQPQQTRGGLACVSFFSTAIWLLILGATRPPNRVNPPFSDICKAYACVQILAHCHPKGAARWGGPSAHASFAQ